MAVPRFRESRLLRPECPVQPSNVSNLTSYPKHVWSPAGGWYAQPANWKQNTFILGAAVFGLTCIIWKISAEKEEFVHKPEPGRFYPSRQYDPRSYTPRYRGQKENLVLTRLLSQLEPATEGVGRGRQEGGAGAGEIVLDGTWWPIVHS